MDFKQAIEEITPKMTSFIEEGIKVADKYGIPRDIFLRTTINSLKHAVTIGTFKDYKIKEVKNDK